jgi:hypothetical protein
MEEKKAKAAERRRLRAEEKARKEAEKAAAMAPVEKTDATTDTVQ